MTQPISHFEVLIEQLRPMLPKHTSLARAIDQHESWEQIAMKAIDDGYIEVADEFVRFVEACMQNSAR